MSLPREHHHDQERRGVATLLQQVAFQLRCEPESLDRRAQESKVTGPRATSIRKNKGQEQESIGAHRRRPDTQESSSCCKKESTTKNS
mmetsp:Transcript_8919/g.18532  ORF Transcript_8919/g.18532 Transcript_8919/m.18532 type:complete len:88 (-) Transcript_8919:87-350(-)